MKKLLTMALLAGIMAIVAAAPAMASQQQNPNNQTVEPMVGCSGSGCWPSYSERDLDTDVKSIKYLLRYHGFAKYSANDPNFGPQAVESVNSFKSAEGLSTNAIVDAETWRALVTPVKPGDESEAVSALQIQLSEQYGYDLPVTGTYGRQTKNAVIDFKRQQGLSANGNVGVGVWRVLVATA